QATITTPRAEAWNAVSLPPVNLTAGQQYWIAVMAPAGDALVYFRDQTDGGLSRGSASATLTALPATWATGASWTSTALSAYVSQTSTATTLVGDTTVEPLQEIAPPGEAVVYPYTAAATGTATAISVYLDGANTTGAVIAGLYTDNGNSGAPAPATLLAQATMSAPQAGAWNTVSL